MKTKLIRVCNPTEIVVSTTYRNGSWKDGTLIGYNFLVNPDKTDLCIKVIEKLLAIDNCTKFTIDTIKEAKIDYPISKIKDIYDILETILDEEATGDELDEFEEFI